MSSRRSSSRRLIRPSTVIAGLFLLLVGLALLAIPFLKAPSHAASARADLDATRNSLATGDIGAATASVRSARRHVDQVQGAMQGVGGDVWRWAPVVGGTVSDIRHLGNALEGLTSVAELALETWPQVNGDQATLLDDGTVDLQVLGELTDTVRQISSTLSLAETELDGVEDERTLGGRRLAQARDQALTQIVPLSDGVDAVTPVLEQLPRLLGSDDERKFLIAMLNPSELRFSGGAVLALSELTTRDGSFEISEAFDTSESPAFFRPFYWKKVKGNPFHRGRQSAQTATYAPSWPVSGNELLNAFRSLRGRPGAGVIAVDSVALGRLLEFTGPITVAGYPPLTSENFVFETIGNYEDHPDTDQRRQLNKALAPAFTEALFAPNDVVAKLTTLHDLAEARHFAVYFRTPEAQEAFGGLGMTGDLPDTEHDYVGVFSQNTNIAKSDYWQRRTVSSRVRLAEDGSARVRLTVEIHNDSPPAPPGFVDPRAMSYTTRWNTSSVGVFLPLGATIRTAQVDGTRVPFTPNTYFGRPFVRRTLEFAPQQRRTYTLEYDVPAAATVDGSELTYRLDATPQGMVVPEALSVRVRWPKGYDVSQLPEGWTRTGPGVASYEDPALITQPSFTLTGSDAAATAP